MYSGDQNERIYENLILIMRPWSSLLHSLVTAVRFLAISLSSRIFQRFQLGLDQDSVLAIPLFQCFQLQMTALKFAV